MHGLSQAMSAGCPETAARAGPRSHRSPQVLTLSPSSLLGISPGRTVVVAKSCGSAAARGMVVMVDNVGTRPDSAVKRRGSRGPLPLRGGETKPPVTPTWGSPRGLCWFRKKSSMAAGPLCYYKHSNFRTRGLRIGNWTAITLLYKPGADLQSAVSDLRRLWGLGSACGGVRGSIGAARAVLGGF